MLVFSPLNPQVKDFLNINKVAIPIQVFACGTGQIFEIIQH
jgi:hypothetical protein